MMRVVLPPELLTGIPDIDDQHRALFAWTNAVFSLGTVRGDRTVALRAAQFLVAYAEYHFAAEEYAMVASAYPELVRHRGEHAVLRRKLAVVARAINSGAPYDRVTTSLQALLNEWLLQHIRHADGAFARYCADEPSVRTLSLPSPQELRASGLRTSDYERVEVVHTAGEISAEEVKARLGGS
jgi:hemerythrin